MMVRHLPKEAQKKALLYGLGGAFLFRLIAIIFASIVLRQWWLQAIGSLYLLWVPTKHFISHARSRKVAPTGASFWQTVVAVELTDIAFAVDSILAGVTFVDNRQEKLWVVYLGAVIGIVLLRFAASMFIKLLEKYPVLDHVAYLLVAWVGVKLAFLAGHTYGVYHPEELSFHFPEMPQAVFWSVLLAIGGLGSFIAIKRGNHQSHIPDNCGDAFDRDQSAGDVNSVSDVS